MRARLNLKIDRSKLFFLGFMVSIGVHKSSYLIDRLIGINIQSLIGVSLLIFPVIFLISAVVTARTSVKLSAIIRKDNLLLLTLSIVIFDLMLGIVNGNDAGIVFQEVWTGLIVLLGYILSYSPKVLQMFQQRMVLLVFLVFSVLTYLGTSFLREHLLGYENLSTDITTATLAYEISPILDLWPMIFLIRWFGSKKALDRALALLPAVLYLLFQLYFVKRAPTVRVIVVLSIAVFYYYYLQRNRDFLLRLMVGSIALYLTVIFLTPDNLLDKFQTKDISRQAEARIMLEQFDAFELVFGRGLGGYYLLDDGAGLIEVNTQGDLGKHILHIGFFYPILKGGLLLFFVVFAHIIRSLLKGYRQLRRADPYTHSGFVFILVYSLFRLIEGPISPGVVFDGFLFGLSLGLLNKKVVR